MSFGFSPGDVVAAARLAWSLYEALKDCPEEVEKISKDLTTVYGILNHIKDDLDAPVSAIKNHSECRMRLLETMVRDLEKTLEEVKNLMERYRHLGRGDGKNKASEKDQIWVKMKWVIGKQKIKRVHQDISVHISRFGLLMTAMGNSSLMRVESGLEEMRISSTINEDVVIDNSNTEQADERSEQEYRTSLDPAKSECQTVNHQSSNEAGRSHQTLHIDADGIYLHLIKPSEVFITNLSTLNSDDQEEISLLILDCCSMACYAFYENNELWRTRYSAISQPFEKRLFEKFVAPQLRLPRDFTFFELREWISRIRHALDRVGEDACSSRAVDNFVRAHGQGFNDAERIPRMKWPLGGVDVLLSEESVVQARNLCNHLRYWEGAQWLKALHMKLLEPDIQGLWYLEIFEKWLFYKDSVLKRTPQGPEVVPRLDYKAVGAARKRTRTDDGVVKDAHEDVLPTMSSTQVAHLTEETSVEG